ncbi:MAG: flavin reductase family protein [Aminobacterium sp.]|jgi:ferric-chelate reductase [NAD(P)H]|uniref:flavin reductase family protein n=1 Tax=unclassified Aminobacterium TaxID=2685012 RepID=UPI001BCEA136|nr:MULTISPECIES: flavin reductase family protein [unclassified Aminobacterium]MDD2207632.1 flavin reductase family protein [Aminobacterium sp.]MDD3426578.1 flavin reductase family protein [Aminobacterium sp.]MDD3708377.1 flavin reductase family protein [Aminobacterium sp.]MDD4229639.1 flavin reductase family protein [Aminobacterium sp.]MDD4551606.1 flavin reductase family protein [Aminobacterium sp.]
MAHIDAKALFSLSYGMYILSTEYEGQKNGQILNALIQLTSKPICIAACLHRDNYTTELLEKSRRLSISVLEETVPLKFIGVFGFRCGRDFDKFSACIYKRGETGIPIVTEYSLASIEARVLSVTEVHTHKLFIAQVEAAEVIKEGKPLLYADYHTIKKGKSPDKAPSAIFNTIK